MLTRTVALSLAALVALAGCMSGQDDDGGAAAKPPAGGWPQLEDGKLTDRMCGLLTEADYKESGHKLIGKLEPQSVDKGSSNYVSCVGMLGEWLRLDLQPTEESAKIRYDTSLETRKRVVAVEKQETILTQDLLQGADQSWFDYGQAPPGSKPGNYNLQFRRSSLVAWVEIDPVDDKSVKDPKAALLRLAGRVLERIPEVGKTDTGTTPKVRFEVKGNGKVSTISYFTVDHRTQTLKDVQLPWSVEVAMADHGDNPVSLKVDASSPATMNPLALSCSISVRGTVVKQVQHLGFALCDSMSPVR